MKKVELHRHIEGCISPEFFHQLVIKHDPNNELSDFENILEIYDYSTFEGFLNAFIKVVSFIRDLEDIQKMAEMVVDQLLDENIIYAELLFSPQPFMLEGVDLTDMLQTLRSVFDKSGIKTTLIIDIVRNFGVEQADKFLDELLPVIINDFKEWIRAVSIGGDEFNYPPELFTKVFARVRDAGIHNYAHAGEWAGSESIWDAIDLLKVERIGHGIRSIDDPDLIEYLQRENIMLDISPTSNYMTGALKPDDNHPLILLLESGVKISINTDDPGYFKTDLNQEYLFVHKMGVELESFRDMNINAINSSFLNDIEKRELISQLIQ
jgi:adenosine deaminase